MSTGRLSRLNADISTQPEAVDDVKVWQDDQRPSLSRGGLRQSDRRQVNYYLVIRVGDHDVIPSRLGTVSRELLAATRFDWPRDLWRVALGATGLFRWTATALATIAGAGCGSRACLRCSTGAAARADVTAP